MNIRREFIVSHDACLGIIQPQLPQQCYQCYFLFHGSCVGRVSLFVQTAFVTHSDAVLVEKAGVGADVVCGAADMGDAVAGDVEMIADIGKPALLHMAAAEGFYREAAVGTRGGTVDHYQGYAPVVLIL